MVPECGPLWALKGDLAYAPLFLAIPMKGPYTRSLERRLGTILRDHEQIQAQPRLRPGALGRGPWWCLENRICVEEKGWDVPPSTNSPSSGSFFGGTRIPIKDC